MNQNRVGLICGATWHSSIEYYRKINQMIAQKKGEFHSAELVLWNLDFNEIVKHQKSGNWEAIADTIIYAGQSLQRAHCSAFAICSNTLHKEADTVSSKVSIPLLNIGEAISAECKKAEIETLGILGTRFTMNGKFYSDILNAKGIDTITPSEKSKVTVDKIIFEELAHGKISSISKQKYLDICLELKDLGAQGIVLGCTEIGLLIAQKDLDFPVIDSLDAHVEQIVGALLNLNSRGVSNET